MADEDNALTPIEADKKKPSNKGFYTSGLNFNTTKFPHKLKNAVLSSYNYYKSNEGIQRKVNAQQFLVPQYLKGKFTNGVEPRGVLLYHDMGTGKTFAFIACIVAMNKPTICVMASALADNFRKNVAQYERTMHIKITAPIYYVSLDAYNMLEQFGRRLIESGLPSEETIVNRTIIFDEAHEFFSKVTNSTNKNAPKIYSRLMNAVGSTIIFGSGTPISKDPIELVPCFNILHGEAVFPESYKEFYDIFINSEFAGVFDNAERVLDPSNSGVAKQIHDIMEAKLNDDMNSTITATTTNTTMAARRISLVKNEKLLQNRLFGYISYIPRNLKYFPEKRETQIIKVPMEIEFQFSNYRLARVSEIEEVAKGAKFLKKSVGLGKPSLSGNSTYKQKSRAYCNGVYLDGVNAVTRANKSVINSSRAISSSDDKEPKSTKSQVGGDVNLGDVPKIISPKADALVANLEKQPGKGIVYSQFKRNGIYMIANKLLEKGWREVKLSDIEHTVSKKHNGGGVSVNNKDKPNPKTKTSNKSADKTLNVLESDKETPADINFQIRDKDTLEFDIADEAAEEEENADDLFEELRAQIIIDPTAASTAPAIRDRADNERDAAPAPPENERYSKTFIVYDGDVPPNDRKKILSAYNAESNRFGQNVRIILVSSIGTRGINLLCGLHGHYFEPHWYLSTYLQFETRISRFMSHVTMPPEFRYTQLFVYLTTLPDLPDSNWEEPETTDETIYYNSIFKQYIIDSFLKLYSEVSLECGIIDEITERENNIRCLQYIPADIPLYNKNIYQDLSNPPTLQEIKGNESVSTEPIVVDGIEYKYTYDNDNAKESIYGVSIYSYNKEVGAYTRLLESDPIFIQVYETLQSLVQ